MAIKFSCSACGKRLQASEKMTGKAAACPYCGMRMPVPETETRSNSDADLPAQSQSSDAESDRADSKVEDFTSKDSRIASTDLTSARRSPPTPKRPKPKELTPNEDDFLSEMDLSEAESKPRKPGPKRVRVRKSDDDSEIESMDDYEIPDEPLPPLAKPRRKKAKAEDKEFTAATTGDEVSPVRQNLYWFLLLALIPLCVNIVRGKDDVEARLISTLQKHPELKQLESNSFSKDELLRSLPEHKIDGAWLSGDSSTHWWLALLSAIAFTTLITVLFRTRRAPPWELLWRGLFIGTVGIILLLLLQFVAQLSLGLNPRRAHVVVFLILYLVKFIGFSYYCAMNPENGFFLSFLGFTCGVGLCEELCKAMLLLGHYRHSDKTAGWGTACAWGLACGAGFGVSEGVMYSGEHYNGITGAEIYAVRFISCVALHAIWSGTAAILLYRSRDMFRGDMEWDDVLSVLISCFGGVIILHGLYDTFLKREMDILALATALGSFGWLAYLIQQSRARTKKSGVQ
ncbi:MAG: hypothetical protein JWM11_2214 [Planctomycetaceae bacterium]|nr:hypothetical protein [Planctomycetaceae bacterium]